MKFDELYTILDPDKRNLLQVKYSSDKRDQKIIHTLMGNDVSIRDFISMPKLVIYIYMERKSFRKYILKQNYLYKLDRKF